MSGSMQTDAAARRAVWKRWLIAGAVCFWSAASPARSTLAEQTQGEIVLAPATVAVTEEMEAGVLAALSLAPDLLPAVPYFAITDVRDSEGWALVSVIGLAQVGEDLAWGIDDGAWFGLVLLHQGADGAWGGAVRGSPEFARLLAEAPEAFIGPEARTDLVDIQSRTPLTAGDYIFPWEAATSMLYGFLGVHDNGFSFGDHVGWKAVDMASDGDTAAGHAPNRLLAAQGGTITYKCLDGNNAAIYMEGGNFFYTHLAPPGPDVGGTFAQGAELGPMQVGTFGTQGSGCGWAQQSAGWFHVHWGFPDEDLVIGDWTLSMTTEDWTNGAETISPGDWEHWLLAPEPGPRVSGNTGVGGARLSYDAGGPQSVNADVNGAYSIPVPEGWSGSITPSLPGWRFDPPVRTYDSVGAGQTAQNYAARALAQPRPADGEQVCNPVGIGVGLLLTDDTRTAGGDLDATTFLLRLDGANVTSQASTRVQSTAPALRATLQYTAAALSPGAHTASFRYDDLGRTVNVNWSFTVPDEGCGELLAAPAAAETSRALTNSALSGGDDQAAPEDALQPNASGSGPVERPTREQLAGPSATDGQHGPAAAPTQTAQVAQAGPVLPGVPPGCLPWGLTCPRTISLKP